MYPMPRKLIVKLSPQSLDAIFAICTMSAGNPIHYTDYYPAAHSKVFVLHSAAYKKTLVDKVNVMKANGLIEFDANDYGQLWRIYALHGIF